jgi:hypothetical protein
LVGVAVEPVAIAITSLRVARDLWWLNEFVRDAQQAGVLSPGEGAAWLDSLEAADHAGRFCMTFTIFVVSGRKA